MQAQRPEIFARAHRLNIRTAVICAAFLVLPVALLNWVSLDYDMGARRLWASLLTIECLVPSALYIARGERGLRVWPFIAGFYFLQFALPAFTSGLVLTEESSSAAEQALILSCVGVGMLTVGDLIGNRIGTRFSSGGMSLDGRRVQKISIILCLLALLKVVVSYTIGLQFLGGFRQVADYALSPYLPLALLWGLDARTEVRKDVRLLTWGFFVAFSIIGLAQGALEPALMPLLVYILVRWDAKGMLPVRALLTLVLLFVIIQPAKGLYRSQIWSSPDDFRESGFVDSLIVFGESVSTVWTDGSMSDWEAGPAQQAITRLDSLYLFNTVVKMTPEKVPYQLGNTYSYFIYTWVPRFIWPQKPIAREANDWFALAYGFSLPEQIGATVVGMPQLVESYINFGPLGVIVVSLLIGLLYGVLSGKFTGKRGGLAGSSVVVVLITGLMGISTSTGQVLSGIIQQTVVYVAILWLMRAKKNKAYQARFAGTVIHAPALRQ